jgi:hypothetical protein
VLCRTLLSEGLDELRAKLPVFVGQVADALPRHVQPTQQRCVGGALSRRDSRRGCSPVQCTQPVDLGAQIGLGIQPRPGYPSVLCHRLEGDWQASIVQHP